MSQVIVPRHPANFNKASPHFPFAAALFALFLSLAQAQPADTTGWPRWRGPLDNGSTSEGNIPVKWETTDVLWSAALPGKGCSTPIVSNRRIVLTAPTNGLDAVLAFDWAGKPLWTTTLGHEQSGRHRNGSGSNPSPATDGKTIFVYFKSGNLATLGWDGKVHWQTNLVDGFGPETLYWDQGTSPALTEKDVVIVRMHHGESWLAAFDKATGKLHWKVSRDYETPVEGDHAYTTPLIIRHEGKEAILIWGGQHLTAHTAADGQLLWTCGDFNPQSAANWPAVASPVISGDTVVVPGGRSDRGQPRLYGIKLGGAGDVTSTHRLWTREDTGTFVPTPAEYKGRIYLLRDRAEVECIEPSTGKTVWKDALPKASSNYYASPLVAGGKLYAIREDGAVFVARIDDGLEVVAQNKMDDRIIASPVAVEGRLLIRGQEHLFCIGTK
jgi:outer membrane protein assembly factor BamB